jgi:hypothetical protein
MFATRWRRVLAPAVIVSAVLGALALTGTAQGSPADTAGLTPQALGAHQSPHRLNVRDYGAVGDGTTNDSPAVDAAITAANAAGGAVVDFPAGTYLAGGSIHMKSNVVLDLAAGATLLGAASGYDAAEPNPYDAYQDYGHSHFHDAMIWGDGLRNIGFIGSGVIDGGGHFITGNPKAGQADKLISLTRCTNLTVSGITLRRGGHFGMLINGCTNVWSDHLTIDTASDRDGWNVISTRNALITNITVASNDDALVFKSDWALGATLPSGNVLVDHAKLSARCCNALMFGSETCGDFTNYLFNDIAITGAGKSGLGIVSMDGARISHVYYNHVTMSGTASPITEKVGTRARCGNSPGVGSISDIHYNDVTGTAAGAYSPTLWGQPGQPIHDVTFAGVHLTLPGGHAPMDPMAVPTDNGDYNPNSLSTRPAYGFYLHNVARISFDDSSFGFAADDGRPAFIVNAGRDVALRHVSVQRGTASPFDLGFQSVSGYRLSGTPGRISTPGSTGHGPDNFALSASPAAQTGVAGTSVAYRVHTAVVAGRPGPVTLSASGLPAGTQVTFAPNPVRPGQDATATVTVDPGTRNGTYPLTVVGTDATATQYAPVDLTVTGGTDLAVTDLAVADTANAADWSVQENLQAGAQLYGDRTFTVASVPAALRGALWIRTANDSKTATVDPLATFTLASQATVSVAVDARIGRRPWMDASWVDTGTQLADTEGGNSRTFEVFARSFPAGPVTLGPNADPANGSSMYTVAIT